MMGKEARDGGQHRGKQHWITGLVLIGVGSLLLWERLSYGDGVSWRHYWPLIITVIGLGRIIDARSLKHLAEDGFLIFLGLWLFASLEHAWGLSFRTSWPMVVIAVGLRHIVVGLSKSDNQSKENQA
jgi:hypothetical protein